MRNDNYNKPASTRMESDKSFFWRLTRYYSWYTVGFILFLLVLAVLEHEGMPRAWIGYLFMFVTIALYAGIGVVSRTGPPRPPAPPP